MTDSSSEEEKSRFESAIDPSLNPFKSEAKVASRRIGEADKDDEDIEGSNGFTKFIAKRLRKSLDKCLVPTDPKKKKNSNIQSENEEYIKLFSTSKNYITELNSENSIKQRQKKRKRHKSSSSSEDDMEKLSSVAVSGEWVLNKCGVYDFSSIPEKI